MMSQLDLVAWLVAAAAEICVKLEHDETQASSWES